MLAVRDAGCGGSGEWGVERESGIEGGKGEWDRGIEGEKQRGWGGVGGGCSSGRWNNREQDGRRQGEKERW